jgi:hypothetical protein
MVSTIVLLTIGSCVSRFANVTVSERSTIKSEILKVSKLLLSVHYDH